jgi:hypothetical protein
VLGIALDDEGAAAVGPFAQSTGINYPLALGSHQVTTAYGGIETIPTAFLIGRSGGILKTYAGAREKAEFQADIQSALQQTSASGQEHPTEPPQTPAKPAVSLSDVGQSVESYVKEHSKHDAFAFNDPKTGNDVSLKLEKVHLDRLSQVSPDLFFACADFKTVDGQRTFDLDFFVQGASKEKLTVLEDKTSLHKEDGQERYTWKLNENTGKWEQMPVGAQLIEPADLATLLRAGEDKAGVLLHIGVRSLYEQAHIPGFEYVAAASDPDGLRKLRARVEGLPRDKSIVLYCGCCPWNDCPNIRPAYQELHAIGFSNVKLLHLPDNLGKDWANKGYPVTQGK